MIQFEITTHGPQWQKRIRVQVGTPGHMTGHGTMYVSEEFALILERLVQTAVTGMTVRVVNRSGVVPTFITSQEE